jgi:electron transfer flavoprotein beta subunit
MHIVVITKQVLDPEGVNSYALWGKLEVDPTERSFTVAGVIPRIINAYDEQAMEAAMRVRDNGVQCTITALSVGTDSNTDVLKRCLALGANDAILVQDPMTDRQDGFRTASLIAAAVRQLGNVDLILAGRQGSDFDQGVVPGVLAERLDWALITLASDVQSDSQSVRVRRVTSAGPEEVEAALPAVVSVSNEIGTPRPPTSRGMLEARRKKPTVLEASTLLSADPETGTELVRITVPSVLGHCEIVEGDSARSKVAELLRKLSTEGVLVG